MFGKDKVPQSLVDAVTKIMSGEKVVETKQPEQVEILAEKAPPGFEGTVKSMKKHKEISNPFALAWSMKNKGYKSHKKADGTQKEEVESVEEALKGNQKKIDKNHNGKIDAQDFKILRKEETVEEGWDDMVKAARDNVKNAPKPNGGSGIKKGKSYGNQKPEPEKEVKEAIDPAAKTVDTLAGPMKGGKDNDHKSYKIKLKVEGKTPIDNDVPFEPPYSGKPETVTDKSGAKHSPMSRVKDLARNAMSKVKKDMKDKK